MTLGKPIYLFVLILSAIAASFGQSPCPKVQFNAPHGLLLTNQSHDFGVDVDGVDAEKLTFTWTLSSGRIVDGQGTKRIVWDPVDEGRKLITVSLQITGLPTNCPDTVENSFEVTPFVCLVPLDQYGRVKKNDEMARLDNAYYQASRSADTKAFLIIRLNVNDSRKYKVGRLNRILELFNYRKYDLNLFSLVIYESDDEERTTFSLIPVNEELPDLGIENYSLFRASELKQELPNLFKGNK